MGGRSVFLSVVFIHRSQLLFGIVCAAVQIDEPCGKIPAPAVLVPEAQKDGQDVPARAGVGQWRGLVRRLCFSVHVIHHLS